MRNVHQTEYFTVFEATFSNQHPMRWMPMAATSQSRRSNLKCAALLAALLVGATSTAGAFVIKHQPSASHAGASHGANLIKFAGAGGVEEALW